MNVYPIPDALADAYNGTGHALAAIHNGIIMDLVYLRTILPDLEPEKIKEAITDIRLAPSINHLSKLGVVSVGMVSSWEFCEL